MSNTSKPKPAIEVKGLTKTFKIPLDKGRSVKSRILGKAGKGYREFTPLNDVSFTIYEGDFFGIVGRNGSGKSTLLKTIAGVYQPTAGKVDVNGVLVPFIELGVGFNPNLSGRENVYLNAALLGFSRDEIDDMYDDIVDFAELHDFMEERLQNYSSGMQVRLAFSISIKARGDILLLDEVLAVGDTAFQRKCFDYFEHLKREKKTVVLVTHSMGNVERFCNRALLLNEGKIEYIGDAEEVSKRYTNLFTRKIDSSSSEGEAVEDTPDQEVRVSSLETFQHGQKTRNIEALKPFTVSFSLEALVDDLEDINPVLHIKNERGQRMLISDVMHLSGDFVDLKKDKKVNVSYQLKDNIYTNGEYEASIIVNVNAPGGGRRQVLLNDNGITFAINGIENNARSLVHPNIEIEVK